MTAAGVQNIDSSVYVPPPPSSSTVDAKGTSAGSKSTADPQAADTQGQPSDFQSELELQQAGTKDAGPADSAKSGSEKSSSRKTEKKRDPRLDDSNVSAALPVQVGDPQQQVLPLTFALPQLQEYAQPDEKATATATAEDQARSTDNPAQPVLDLPQAGRISLPSDVAASDAKQSSAPKQSGKLPQNALRASTANVTASPTTDSSKTQLASGLPASTPLPSQPAPQPIPDQAPLREQDAAQNSRGEAARNQPVLPIEHNLPAAPSEPASPAVQETPDAKPTSASTVAFAARMTPVPGKPNQPAAANPTQIPAVTGAQPPQIPIRHGAMAQIIQSAAAGDPDDSPKKDASAAFDATIRAEARSDVRIDMAAPQAGTANQPSQAPAPATPQPPAPTAQLERVIEPPAAPPVSNHDIRVRVPDNNGGSTQVRFVESGGEVRVSVRTSDDALAQNLRSHLNDLTQRLSDGGMPAEIWKPASNGASSQNDQHTSNQDDRGSGQQGSGGHGGQQDRHQKRPAWLEEMEASLRAE